MNSDPQKDELYLTVDDYGGMIIDDLSDLWESTVNMLNTEGLEPFDEILSLGKGLYRAEIEYYFEHNEPLDRDGWTVEILKTERC